MKKGHRRQETEARADRQCAILSLAGSQKLWQTIIIIIDHTYKRQFRQGTPSIIKSLPATQLVQEFLITRVGARCEYARHDIVSER